MYKLFESTIERIGPENDVQIVTDTLHNLSNSVIICTTFPGPILSIVLSNNLYILFESVDSLLASTEQRNTLPIEKNYQNIDDHFTFRAVHLLIMMEHPNFLHHTLCSYTIFSTFSTFFF